MDDGRLIDLESLADNNLTTIQSLENLCYMIMPHFTPEELTFITVLYILTAFASVFGNILSIIVFVKGKKCKTEIKPFLLNLAIADLIMGISCPPFILLVLFIPRWIFSTVIFTVIPFLQLFSATMSISTIMVIGVDQFIAILFPLKFRITMTRSSCTIALIQLFSVAIASVRLILAGVKHLLYEGDVVTACCMKWGRLLYYHIYSWVIVVSLCFIPFAMLIVSYLILANILWKRGAPGKASKSRDQLALREKIKDVKMLLTIVIMFGICWLPFHIFVLYFKYHPELVFFPGSRFLLVLFALNSLAIIHNFVNPIIYDFMDDNFRDDLNELFKKYHPFSSSISTQKAITSHDSLPMKGNIFGKIQVQENSLQTLDFEKRMIVLDDCNGKVPQEGNFS